MKWLLFLAGLAASVAGCSSHDAKALGGTVRGPVSSIAAVQQSTPGFPIVLHGVITKKCPVAGCWFVLRDASGTIKVDTKNAGFVMVDVPLNTSLTVAGLVVTNQGDRLIDATGVRY